jgi:hypothetical protein
MTSVGQTLTYCLVQVFKQFILIGHQKFDISLLINGAEELRAKKQNFPSISAPDFGGVRSTAN